MYFFIKISAKSQLTLKGRTAKYETISHLITAFDIKIATFHGTVEVIEVSCLQLQLIR